MIGRGSSTLEILIAFAMLVLTMTAVILLFFGNQSISIDTQTNTEALYKAHGLLETARAASRQNFLSIVSTTSTEVLGGLAYTQSLVVEDISECKKQATSSTTYSLSPLRAQTVLLATFFVDIAGAFALGGDCLVDSPSGDWENPVALSVADFSNPGEPTGIDVLQGIAYIASTQGLHIVDPGNPSGSIVFPDSAGINAVDVARDTATGRIYAYVARNATTSQFAIIDVTDETPVLKATRTLQGAQGTDAEGWRVLYHNKKAYVFTRYLGPSLGKPEFHIFNVADPTDPFETGSKEINTSVYGVGIRKQFVAGTSKYFVYMATTHDDKEVMVLDVTDPINPTEVMGAHTNIPGSKDGRSIFIHGTKLFVGLRSGAGAEVYVFDASDPGAALSGLPLLMSADTSPRSITGIRASGNVLFLAGVSASPEVQVWRANNLSSLGASSAASISGLVGTDSTGIDVDGNYIYAVSTVPPRLRIIHSP